jgi:hypothetical protein
MFSFLANFSHSAEMRESKDEMLVGEIVRAMARQGYPAIEFRAGDDRQRIRFLTIPDPTLYSVILDLDRKTGGGVVSQAVFGSKATLNVTAQIRNNLSDPDDLVKMYKTDLANIFKMPVIGGIKVNHALNSVYATTQKVIEIDNYVGKGEAGATKLAELLGATIGALKEKLEPFHKTQRR